MKTIRIFRFITFFIFGILLLQVISSIIITTSEVFFNTKILNIGFLSGHNASLLLKIMVVLKLISILLFVLGIYFLTMILRVKSIKEYFNETSNHQFRKAGVYILSSGLLGLFLTLAAYFSSEFAIIFHMNFNNLPFLISMIIGLFLILFSKILKTAELYKQENDLTI